MIAPVPNKLSSYWWNHLISPIKVTTAPIAPVSGHAVSAWHPWEQVVMTTYANL